jgi:hypothetical protein
MKIIAHRKNTKLELINTPEEYGVEVDIRSYGEDLIIQHDPYVQGERFEDWLQAFNHQTLILNVKEEGLEAKLIALMEKYQIQDYFFLDQSFPFLVKWAKQGYSKSSVRVSEFESLTTALTLKDKVEWVWVDCFSKFPLDIEAYNSLKDASFKLCLVSPELQGREPEQEIFQLKALFREQNIKFDAVCTKRPELWQL